MKVNITEKMKLDPFFNAPVFLSYKNDNFEVKNSQKSDFRNIFNELIYKNGLQDRNDKNNDKNKLIFNGKDTINKNANRFFKNREIEERFQDTRKIDEPSEKNPIARAENKSEQKDRTIDRTKDRTNQKDNKKEENDLEKSKIELNEKQDQVEQIEKDGVESIAENTTEVISEDFSGEDQDIITEGSEPAYYDLKAENIGTFQVDSSVESDQENTFFEFYQQNENNEGNIVDSKSNLIEADSQTVSVALDPINKNNTLIDTDLPVEPGTQLSTDNLEEKLTSSIDELPAGEQIKSTNEAKIKDKTSEDKINEISDSFEKSDKEMKMTVPFEKKIDPEKLSDHGEIEINDNTGEEIERIAPHPTSNPNTIKKGDRKENDDAEPADSSKDIDSTTDSGLVTEEIDEFNNEEFENLSFEFGENDKSEPELSEDGTEEFRKLFDVEIGNISRGQTADPAAQKTINKELNFNRFEEFKYDREIFNQFQAQLQSRNIGDIKHSEIRFSLRPDNLGEVSMKLVMENNVLTAKIKVENHEVRQSIESNFAQLEKNLNAQGIKVEKIEVSLKNETGTSGNFDEQRSNRGQAAKENFEFIKNTRGDKLYSTETKSETLRVPGVTGRTNISNENRLDYLA